METKTTLKIGRNRKAKRVGILLNVKTETKMNKMYLKMTAIIMVSIFLFSSCASIVSKSTYPLSINSSPSNAKVSITDKKGKEIYLGNTPATVKLKAGAGFFSKAEYQVKFSSMGYDEKIVPITFKLDGWYFGNLLWGGVLGMLIIDPATGAMWKIETEFLNETLSKSTASIDPEMKIMNINEIPDNWKTHLVRVN